MNETLLSRASFPQVHLSCLSRASARGRLLAGGGPPVSLTLSGTTSSNNQFKGALEGCELDDLGFSADIFIWRNKQMTGYTHIRERLDRAVANAAWRMMFPLMHVKNGDPYHSDHRPVVVSTEMIQRAEEEVMGVVSSLKLARHRRRAAGR